ncbi:hypothetical protein JHK86_048522 [Glycine max]|nr:hypothetical protein JHK86_048522 [Glycine max]
MSGYKLENFDCGLTQVWYISCIQFLGVIDLGQLKLMTKNYLRKSTLLTLEFIVPNYGEH